MKRWLAVLAVVTCSLAVLPGSKAQEQPSEPTNVFSNLQTRQLEGGGWAGSRRQEAGIDDCDQAMFSLTTPQKRSLAAN
jgi:hypothetical protein